MVIRLSLLRSGAQVAFFTLISRIFGLIRELSIANLFGTSLYADAVNMALRFPNLFRRSFAEGALTSAFVPIYSSCIVNSKTEASKFANQTLTFLAIIVVSVTIICEIFMPNIVHICAPGFASNKNKFELSIILCRITTPYLIFICLSALLGGVLNSNRCFAPFAAIPVVLSIMIVVSCIIPVGNNELKAINIAISIFVAGIFQLLIMIYYARKFEKNLFFLQVSDLLPQTRIFLKNFVPEIISSSSTQLNLFISQSIASFAPGAISILSYADRIYQFPLSIIGICFGSVLLPLLSRLYKENKVEEAAILQEKALKLGLFLSIGAMSGIIFLAEPIIFVIYERGAFSHLDTLKTSETLAIFAIGLPAYVINKILTPVFYSRLDTKTPMKITLITITINCILNGSFVYLGLEHLGIALGTSIAAWCNIIFIWIYFRLYKIDTRNKPIKIFIFKLVISVLLMFAMLYVLKPFYLEFIYQKNKILSSVTLFAIILIGGITYICSALAIKSASKEEISNLLNRTNTIEVTPVVRAKKVIKTRTQNF
ncbi:MAG: murein biosynthesis integral membrane protein MurJ [Rickettsiaceae bacterium]|nr:murein biosynthesis integral membrane protein MurJ [Rickettsiaceae bacterium]